MCGRLSPNPAVSLPSSAVSTTPGRLAIPRMVLSGLTSLKIESPKKVWVRFRLAETETTVALAGRLVAMVEQLIVPKVPL